jgi:translation initiation factor 2 alpha subunit (eIF-2alpha)
MSNALCRDTIVVAKVEQITEVGLFVILLEYDNRIAFVSIQEMSQRKTSSIIKHSPIGSICAFRVVNVTDKAVDLSRRGINQLIAESILNKYLNNTTTVNKSIEI